MSIASLATFLANFISILPINIVLMHLLAQKKNKLYQINNELISEIKKIDFNASNFYFINKGYKEIQINFIKIKSIYNYYTTFFYLYSAL